MYLSPGDPEALLEKILRLSGFIQGSFDRSSRKDQLIEVVRECIATDTYRWYSCLDDFDNWLDWERFAALELLVAVVGLHYGVLGCPFLLPNFTQLKHLPHRTNTQVRSPKNRILSCC